MFWVCGAAHSLSWDYLPGVPQGEEAERRYSWREKPLGGFFAKHILRLSPLPQNKNEKETSPDDVSQLEKCDEKQVDTCTRSVLAEREPEENREEADPDIQLVRRISRMSTGSHHTWPVSVSPKGIAVNPQLPSLSCDSLPRVQEDLPTPAPTQPTRASFFSPIFHSLRPLTVIITPVTIAIAISLPIALIDDLKALFVDISDTGGPSWHGPDGRPPLSFIIDTGEVLQPHTPPNTV